MKKFLYLLPLAALVASCSGESHGDGSSDDSTQTDTSTMVVQSIQVDMDALLAKFPAASDLPFTPDSSYLSEINRADSPVLSDQEVQFLAQNLADNDLSYSASYTLEDVHFFDSLKTDEAYEQYLEVLDIGMMADATAYPYGNLKLDDSTTILLWCVSYHTYEACPYSAGELLFGSVMRHNEIRSCSVIGEDSGGGDAPYWSSTLVLCSLTKNKFTAAKIDENGGDTDEEGNELSEKSVINYELSVDAHGIWQVKNSAE